MTGLLRRWVRGLLGYINPPAPERCEHQHHRDCREGCPCWHPADHQWTMHWRGDPPPPGFFGTER